MFKNINKETLENLGYEVEVLETGIYEIKNFLTEQELNLLYSEASEASEEAWTDWYMSRMVENAQEKFGRSDIENLVEEGLLEVTANFVDKNLALSNFDFARTLLHRCEKIFDLEENCTVTGFLAYQRLYEGSNLVSHFDQYSDKLVKYAAVLYLNNDYTEGQLFFPNFNKTFVPDPGSLVIFPGTREYEHGVHTVGPGPVRYVIPAFIKESHPAGSMVGWGNFG